MTGLDEDFAIIGLPYQLKWAVLLPSELWKYLLYCVIFRTTKANEPVSLAYFNNSKMTTSSTGNKLTKLPATELDFWIN